MLCFESVWAASNVVRAGQGVAFDVSGLFPDCQQKKIIELERRLA